MPRTDRWDEVAVQLEQLGVSQIDRIRDIREKFSMVASVGTISMPDFTLHNQTHSDNLIRIIARIKAESKFQLEPYEAYLLAASAYLHDLGMFFDETRFSRQILPNSAVLRLCPENCCDDPCAYGLGNQDVGLQVRSVHHLLTAYWLQNSPSSDFGFEEKDRSFLMTICRGHRKANLRTKGCSCFRNYPLAGTVIRIGLLASLLRVADALDFYPERAPYLVFKQRALALLDNPIALDHWIKHYLITDPYITVPDEDGVSTLRCSVHFAVPQGEINGIPRDQFFGALLEHHLVEARRSDLDIDLYPPEFTGELKVTDMRIERRAHSQEGVRDLPNEIIVDIEQSQCKDFQSYLRRPKRISTQRSSLPERIPFTNREDEIKLVLTSFAPAYYLLDAPAGYGKTELLKELDRRFKEPDWDWRSAYVSVDEQDTLAELTTKLFQELKIDLVQDTSLPWGCQLGGALLRQWKNEPQNGMVLLIDFENKPALPIIQEFLDEFIPAVQASLRTLEFFFGTRQNRFRGIFAGRHLAMGKEVRTTNLPLHVLSLTPFEYKVIRDSARDYMPGESQESVAQLAAHLIHFTGGHPRCVAQGLEMYADKGLTPDSFFQFFGEELLTKDVGVVVNDIRGKINEELSGLDEVLDRLSIFRRSDHAILGRVVAEAKVPGICSGYDLADRLTATYLFARKDRFLQDDITRRLLAIWARHTAVQEFVSRCKHAQEMSIERVRDPRNRTPEIWVMEYLFQSLQQYANVVQDKEQRRSIRNTFLNTDVPRVLQAFMEGQSISLDDRRTERGVLCEKMDQDWEFSFTVNYYLREDQYNEEPYNELLQRVAQFFA